MTYTHVEVRINDMKKTKLKEKKSKQKTLSEKRCRSSNITPDESRSASTLTYNPYEVKCI